MPMSFAPEFVYVGVWATRPSAATAGAGARIIVTDYRYSQWVSDGTNWRPAGGRQVINRQTGGTTAAPLTVVTGGGTNLAIVPPSPCMAPAGMLFPGCSVDYRMQYRKTGTETANAATILADTVAGGATPNNWTIVAGLGASAGNPSLFVSGGFAHIDAGGVVSYPAFRGGYDHSVASSAPVERTDANIFTEDRYLCGLMGSGFTSASTLELRFIELAILG